MRKTLNDGYCFHCGSIYQLSPHEPYCGRNRQLSIKYGMVITLCFKCHRNDHDNPRNHNDIKAREYVRNYFEETYPNLDFIEVFK